MEPQPQPVTRLQMMNAMDLAMDSLQRVESASRLAETPLSRLVKSVKIQRRPPRPPLRPPVSGPSPTMPNKQQQLLLVTVASSTRSQPTSTFSTQPSVTSVTSSEWQLTPVPDDQRPAADVHIGGPKAGEPQSEGSAAASDRPPFQQPIAPSSTERPPAD